MTSTKSLYAIWIDKRRQDDCVWPLLRFGHTARYQLTSVWKELKKNIGISLWEVDDNYFCAIYLMFV